MDTAAGDIFFETVSSGYSLGFLWNSCGLGFFVSVFVWVSWRKLSPYTHIIYIYRFIYIYVYIYFYLCVYIYMLGPFRDLYQFWIIKDQPFDLIGTYDFPFETVRAWGQFTLYTVLTYIYIYIHLYLYLHIKGLREKAVKSRSLLPIRIDKYFMVVVSWCVLSPVLNWQQD